MHVMVLGAGVVGVSSAYFLRQQGFEVTVVDRAEAPAMETSFANGGQISVSHAEPWANPGAPKKLLKWLLREDAPLLFRLRADVYQWRWGMRFLLECVPARTRHNILQILNLGSYSRATLQELRRRTGIEYDQLTRGILHFYTDPKEFEAALAPAQLMREFGCERQIVNRQQILQIEPAFKHAIGQIVGGTYTAADESGDVHLFTQRLARMAEAQGVRFVLNTSVERLLREGDALAGVQVRDAQGRRVLSADAYVLSLGAYSPLLSRPVGVDLDIYPAKGYSATVSTAGFKDAPTVSMTDDGHKLVFSRLGNRLRIAGTAELNGYRRDLNFVRCEALIKRTRELFPHAADYHRPVYWSGLRPTTPSNVPYVGRSRLRNLYLNTGHGTLGWTMGPGSGLAIADIIAGKRPEVDFAFCGIESRRAPLQAPELRPGEPLTAAR